jgi:hypothetical protein
VTVDGGYYTGAGEDVFLVFDPSLGFTTGGGWFYWPGTADRTNFGFTMQYNQGSSRGKGKGVKDKEPKAQGSLLFIRHLDDGTLWRLKSNAIDGMALSEDGWASFLGKATYREPGWEESEGNYDFLVYVEDHGTPGAGVDQFWIQTFDPTDTLVPDLSMMEPAPDNTVTIEGGNIVVPHEGGNGKNKDKSDPPATSASKTGDEPAEIEGEAQVPKAFAVSDNYPNPFNPSTAIQLELPEAVHVTMTVYDISGRIVDRVADREFSEGIHTLVWSAENLPSGIYVYRITAGQHVSTKQMVLLR